MQVFRECLHIKACVGVVLTGNSSKCKYETNILLFKANDKNTRKVNNKNVRYV